jgi:hypothetical protein
VKPAVTGGGEKNEWLTTEELKEDDIEEQLVRSWKPSSVSSKDRTCDGLVEVGIEGSPLTPFDPQKSATVIGPKTERR